MPSAATPPIPVGRQRGTLADPPRALRCGTIRQPFTVALGALEPRQTLMEGPWGARLQIWGPALPNLSTVVELWRGSGDRRELVAAQVGPLPAGVWFDRSGDACDRFEIRARSTALAGEIVLTGELRGVWGDAS